MSREAQTDLTDQAEPEAEVESESQAEPEAEPLKPEAEDTTVPLAPGAEAECDAEDTGELVGKKGMVWVLGDHPPSPPASLPGSPSFGSADDMPELC